MKNKILVLLSIVILIISSLSVGVYATITSANATLSVTKQSYNLDDENDIITVTLKVDNLKSNNGVIAYSAVLEYDKDKLTYLDSSGAGKWGAPSLSEKNGKLVADRADNDFSDDGEELCTIRFKAKAVGENVVIKLSNVELSSGELGGKGLKKINDTQVSFNITSSKNPSTPGGDSGNQGETPGGDSGNQGETPGGDSDNQGGDKKTDNTNSNTNKDKNNTNTNSDKNTSKDNNKNTNNTNTNKTKTNTANNNVNNSNNVGTSNSIFPKAGASTYIIMIIAVVTIIAVVLFVRMKVFEKRVEKEATNIPLENNKKDE